MIELAGLPICGCGVLPSVICMDKDRAHRLASTAEINIPKAKTFTDLAEIDLVAIEKEIGFPAFVKPLRGGSSRERRNKLQRSEHYSRLYRTQPLSVYDEGGRIFFRSSD